MAQAQETVFLHDFLEKSKLNVITELLRNLGNHANWIFQPGKVWGLHQSFNSQLGTVATTVLFDFSLFEDLCSDHCQNRAGCVK
jgi:hypothetical protein